jgi:hypothetical protein
MSSPPVLSTAQNIEPSIHEFHMGLMAQTPHEPLNPISSHVFSNIHNSVALPHT